MKAQKNRSQHTHTEPRRLWRIPRTWGLRARRALVLGACAAAGVIGALIWIFSHPANSAVTRYVAHITAPAPRTFADDNMLWVVPDGLPDLNNNRTLEPAAPLRVSYEWTTGDYAPAFRPNLTAADLARDIRITPAVRGTWRTRGDSELEFTPDTAFPAGQKYTVKISPALFNADVRPNITSVGFTTEKLTASMAGFDIYPDPAHPRSMIGVAVVTFNYPVDTRNFDDKVSLKLDDNKLDFTVKFDRTHRTAMITSAPVAITDTPQVMRLKINRIPAADGDARSEKVTAAATIAAADNFFKISDITTSVVEDAAGRVQQFLILNTTAAVAHPDTLAQSVDVYVLPTHASGEDADAPSHKWAADEITPNVLKASKKLAVTRQDFETPTGVHQYALAYEVADQNPRHIYVSVPAGLESRGGFALKTPVTRVLAVPYPERTVKIAGTGALLSLAGARELGIMARGGVTDAYVNLYKIKQTEINHLISQTYNVFAPNMEFKSWSFGVYDMAVVFQKHISFSDATPTHVNYASVDLGDYLDRTHGDKTGIFVVQTGTTRNNAEYNDKRLILLTDLGIIRKANLDGTSTLFVSNLSDGAPAADVEITVLGRNGNAVWAGRTDANGRADTPRFAWNEYKNEKEPVAFVARRSDDVSFIPYNSAYAQRVEYSKFDIDGVYASSSSPLNAFVFTDRGVYRPGESMTVGGIVKNKSFKSLAGIPVKLEIRNPRGRAVYDRTFSLASHGMFDIAYAIPENAPVGEYNVCVMSLNTKNTPKDTIGCTAFRVEEFVPDTLKITASIAGASEFGWISPDNLTASVSLRNLFGTPAAHRRIRATARLRPTTFTFADHRGYVFTPDFGTAGDMAESAASAARTFSVDLDDTETDDDGNANLDIKFDRPIPDGTYALTLTVRGFEGDATRHVQTTITTRSSNAKYLVGYHANSDLSFVSRDAVRNVSLIAVDHTGARTAASDLNLRIVRRENLTSLVKDYNGYYKYQTVTRDKIITQRALNIPADGTTVQLDTARGGTYYLQVLDASDKILANIEYFVATGDNAEMGVDTNAEMQIKLNAATYAPGDKILVDITAPYAGTGLITLERDRVYAYKWFKTDKTASTQTITVPADFQGTGYVNVSFVRNINSRDIFTTPYTYAVAPFTSDISARKIDIRLTAPDIVRDNRLTVTYRTSAPAKIMIFAVNTGILTVARFTPPNPIAHFFKKAALQVETYQILSLLLPEYKILREFAKTGGGDYDDAAIGDAPLTNPFTRRTDAPVAFYSGILDTVANTDASITFDIPEYFNGAIKIFAVAANDVAIGAADTESKVQSPIIITTAAPLAAAPGDTFDVNTVIANLTEHSGPNATVRVRADTTGGLAVTGASTADLKIAENTEQLWSFGVHTTDTLGNAEIRVTADVPGDNGATLSSRSARTTLSVRPDTAFETRTSTGTVTRPTQTLDIPTPDIYPEFGVRRIYVSRGASAFMRPLAQYLERYPYSCTEQLVSRATPYVLAPNDQVMGTTSAASATEIAATIGALKNRQNDDGSFNMWGIADRAADNENADTAYLTAYVTQFLILARDAGFTVPADMQSRAVDFLRTYAGRPVTDAPRARATAFAIYVLGRAGFVTTSYIDLFQEYAAAHIKDWESDIMGAYIAAAYKMMRQDDAANALIRKYRPGASDDFAYRTMFDNNVANDAMYNYLTRTYFMAPPSIPSSIRAYIDAGAYSSYTSAAVLMGLTTDASDTPISVTVATDDTPIPMETTGTMATATIPNDARKITLNCPECGTNDAGLFYTVVTQGYPRRAAAAKNGIEVIREYRNADGDRIDHANVGDIVTVKIFARAIHPATAIDRVVISDLLPAGFVPDGETLTHSSTVDFTEIREDRVLIFASLTRTALEITYRAQVGAAGTFRVPAIQAASMYNPAMNATGPASTFTVSNDAAR